jgi:hypothetical protein
LITRITNDDFNFDEPEWNDISDDGNLGDLFVFSKSSQVFDPKTTPERSKEETDSGSVSLQ